MRFLFSLQRAMRRETRTVRVNFNFKYAAGSRVHGKDPVAQVAEDKGIKKCRRGRVGRDYGFWFD